MTVVIFNDDGEVLHKIDLSAPPSDHPFMFRLSAPHWHMPVPTSDWLVYHETYTGPFAPESDVEVPRWAPDEKNAQAVDGFLRRCLSGSA
jgi:glucose-6-phosphate isomerase